MITSPNAKLEELAYELLRWYGDNTVNPIPEPHPTYGMPEARIEAAAVIAALTAATPFDHTWTISNHPLVAWIGDTFQVHWKRASQGFAVLAG